MSVSQRNSDRGELIFQSEWYTKEQLQHICNQCKSPGNLKKLGKIVFGDNDVDKLRDKGEPRQYFDGQSSVTAKYDKLFTYTVV